MINVEDSCSFATKQCQVIVTLTKGVPGHDTGLYVLEISGTYTYTELRGNESHFFTFTASVI